MGQSGYIDWHRLGRTFTRARGDTFVYAYWLADYGRKVEDHGVTLLKREAAHPDWFVHADGADQILFSVAGEDYLPSPNVTDAYDTHLTSRPLLAAMALGTVDASFHTDEEYWWASVTDLTRPGKRLVRELSMLYLRPPVLVTFLNVQPMKRTVPKVAGDPATVTEALGLNHLNP